MVSATSLKLVDGIYWHTHTTLHYTTLHYTLCNTNLEGVWPQLKDLIRLVIKLWFPISECHQHLVATRWQQLATSLLHLCPLLVIAKHHLRLCHSLVAFITPNMHYRDEIYDSRNIKHHIASVMRLFEQPIVAWLSRDFYFGNRGTLTIESVIF